MDHSISAMVILLLVLVVCSIGFTFSWSNTVVDLWVIECNQAENITPRVMKRQQERE